MAMSEETATATALREMREEVRRRAERIMGLMGETNVRPRQVSAMLSAIEEFERSIRVIEHAMNTRRAV
jgi:hypothetical protein